MIKELWIVVCKELSKLLDSFYNIYSMLFSAYGDFICYASSLLAATRRAPGAAPWTAQRVGPLGTPL